VPYKLKVNMWNETKERGKTVVIRSIEKYKMAFIIQL
jgi:hypothetical protein